MVLLAGSVFIVIGLLNKIWSWNSHFILQATVATIIATVAEFICGCIVNIWLGWNVWDYSDIPGNVMGQICPLFVILWFFISMIAIVIDDVMRWKFFNEEKPRYKL